MFNQGLALSTILEIIDPRSPHLEPPQRPQISLNMAQSAANASNAASSSWGTIKIVEMKINDEPKLQSEFSIDTSNDLQSIKEKDPFLYYSIHPAVVNANNVSNDETPHTKSYIARSSSKRSKVLQSRTVLRNSRISFECHPDVLIFEEFEDLLSKGADEDDIDLLDIFLKKVCVN